MSAIDWSDKPYPWNEIGPEWAQECKRLAVEPLADVAMQVTPAPGRVVARGVSSAEWASYKASDHWLRH